MVSLIAFVSVVSVGWTLAIIAAIMGKLDDGVFSDFSDFFWMPIEDYIVDPIMNLFSEWFPKRKIQEKMTPWPWLDESGGLSEWEATIRQEAKSGE